MLVKQLGIVGGDLRIIRLAEMLTKEEYKIYTYGLDKYDFTNNIFKCKEIGEISNDCKYVISGIPFSKDGAYVDAPFSNEQINVNEMFQKLTDKSIEEIDKILANKETEIMSV